MNKHEFLKAINNFRNEQHKKGKATDLITFIYLLASEYNEKIYLEGEDLNNLVLKVLNSFN